MHPKPILAIALALACVASARAQMQVQQADSSVNIDTPQLQASIRKKGDYLTGIVAGSFLDKTTGFHDPGFGLDIVDWIMEPGSDEAYRDQLEKELIYNFNNSYHGKTPKRTIEGPQICTRAKALDVNLIPGKDFVAVTQHFKYRSAAPGKKVGSTWDQTIIFPQGKRYFISSDKITSVNDSDAMFLRIDMPGHVKHKGADTFSQVYLSYQGFIPASEFAHNFPPDEKFNYTRGKTRLPQRFIRAYHLRDPRTGADGPWLAGMTLQPEIVSEAWCHERGYVCMIEEFGGKPIKSGQSFSAAFIVGYFDSVEEMEKVYDQYAGATGIKLTRDAWELIK